MAGISENGQKRLFLLWFLTMWFLISIVVPKFKLGDQVRISKYKNVLASWSEKVFVIKNIKNTVPRTYIIKNLKG